MPEKSVVPSAAQVNKADKNLGSIKLAAGASHILAPYGPRASQK